MYRISRVVIPGFNPRVPCGTRPLYSSNFWLTFSFQSTRPVRDATLVIHFFLFIVCFNPRVPCGTRLTLYDPSPQYTVFQSTRPVRDATPPTAPPTAPPTFQSTRPVRDATAFTNIAPCSSHVSIHASRAGRDGIYTLSTAGALVSIHASRAGRDLPCNILF